MAEKIGLYHTLCLPEDTNALNDQCLNKKAFFKQCCQIMREKEKMLLFELKRFKRGLLAFVFETTDRIQHLFWGVKNP